MRTMSEVIRESFDYGIIPNNNTTYIAIKDSSGSVEAVAGYIVKGKRFWFKGAYTPPEHRGKGNHTKLLVLRMNMALYHYKCKILLANCTKDSLPNFLKHGFKVSNKFKNGITQVIYESLS